ncbi:MAG: hypothetical protein H0U74_08630 [Bradymonadaceae bacterium]|nr:hypothetical protein [Lujinxingiaceae bacterium]
MYLFTALGTIAYKCARDASSSIQVPIQVANVDTPSLHTYRAEACNEVADVFGSDKRGWSESAWITYASCFDTRNDSRMVISSASQGLRFYPSSETLYNLVGFHQIALGEHSQAVKTLRTGMRNVARNQSGVMANNLAWAGLWTPREMRLEEARALYQQSLAINANTCETLHTALWVEYAISQRTSGVERFDALKRFDNLRQGYEPCLSRLHNGDWNSLVEVVGAALMFEEVDAQNPGANEHHPTLLAVASKFRSNYRGASIDVICREAMPLAETHQSCVERVHRSVLHLRAEEQASQRMRAVPIHRSSHQHVRERHQGCSQ